MLLKAHGKLFLPEQEVEHQALLEDGKEKALQKAAQIKESYNELRTKYHRHIDFFKLHAKYGEWDKAVMLLVRAWNIVDRNYYNLTGDWQGREKLKRSLTATVKAAGLNKVDLTALLTEMGDRTYSHDKDMTYPEIKSVLRALGLDLPLSQRERDEQETRDRSIAEALTRRREQAERSEQ